MKKQFFSLSVLLLTFLTPAFSQEKQNTEITFIGTEGFMIKNNEKKILIDALYSYPVGNNIDNAEPFINKMIQKGESPFDGCELYFVTHTHPDHYSISMIQSYLSNNPQTVFVGDSTTRVSTLTAEAGDRMFSLKPQKYGSVDTTINGTPFTGYNLKHDSNFPLYNLGYWIDIDGLKIFHTGDNSLEDTTEYINSGLLDKPIDIAFLNYNALLRSKTNSDFFKRHLKAKCIILMHVSMADVKNIRTRVSNLGEGFPPILVFGGSMEKLLVNDSIYFSNLMPEKNGTMKDTLINKNEEVSIEIPILFSDPDEGDEITYSLSNLPKGLTFDSETMTITGMAEKAGKFTVKILGIDNGYSSNSTTFKITVQETAGTGMKETNDDYIYPNPANSEIWFSNLSEESHSIQIFNMNGSKVLDQSICVNPIDISTLEKGVFVVKLRNKEKVTFYNLIKK